ncbi:hypothetical protein PL321_13365 [Caloramator sp. mosi_1]|nr:hypothetical protein [Caloramator sp. mosi_1]WDC85781.1 hypothetical protein PL321_13365 [Caloramator sp. mosi_1]
MYILGESNILNNIKEIETKPIELQDIYQTTIKQVELDVPKGIFEK